MHRKGALICSHGYVLVHIAHYLSPECTALGTDIYASKQRAKKLGVFFTGGTNWVR